jgi:hypothetical protein
MIKHFLKILIISIISIASTKAQKIIVNTNSGTFIEYNLRAIDSITFQNNQMIVTLYGGTVDSYEMDSISSYRYDNTNTSVSELESRNVQELKIYPNPNNGQFSVDYELVKDSRVDVILYNLNGQQVYIQTFEQVPGKYHEVIDVNNAQINAGIYLIELRTSKERFINKLILNK